jgi:predicted nucleic acid-binding protein
MLSIITVGELQAGVMLARDEERGRRLRQLSAILWAGRLIPIDDAAASAYGELRAAAVDRLPSNDMWIAAIALANEFVLMTADKRQAALPLVRSVLIPTDTA